MATALVLAPRFLMMCASSRQMVFHCFFVMKSFTLSSNMYVITTTSPAFAFSMAARRSVSKLSIVTRSDGANFSISVRQLGATEAGAMTSVGPSSAFDSRKAMVCMVFPRPISSANSAPAPQLLRRDIQ